MAHASANLAVSCTVLDSAKNIVFIHYTGNEAEVINFPHRSAIKSTHSFYRTLPSYLKTSTDKLDLAKSNMWPGLGKQVLSTQITLVYIMAHFICSVYAIQDLLILLNSS